MHDRVWDDVLRQVNREGEINDGFSVGLVPRRPAPLRVRRVHGAVPLFGMRTVERDEEFGRGAGLREQEAV